MNRVSAVQRLTGTGRLERDGAVVTDRVGYHITITQQAQLEADSGRATTRAETIEGTLLSPAPADLVGVPVELELEDGRHWACVIESPNGILTDRGGIT